MFERNKGAWWAWGVGSLASLVAPTPAAAERLWPRPSAPIEQAFVTGSVDERRAAAAQLAQFPAESAQVMVRRFLQDEDPVVRQRLGAIAVNHCFSDLVDVAFNWAQSNVPRERWLAVQLLGCARGPDAVRRIGQLLGDSDEDVRLAAVTALRNAGPSEAQLASDFLLLALGDKSPVVLSAAIDALTLLGIPFAVLPLVARLTDDDQNVRYQVARALTAYADARAIPALLMALSDIDPRVVEQAVWALGKIRDTRAIPGLLAVLAQPTFGAAQLAALSVLTQLDPTQGNGQLARLLRRPDVRNELLENQQRWDNSLFNVTECIRQASLDELKFCVRMHLSQAAPLGPVVEAVRDHRLSWEDLFQLGSDAPSIQSGDPALQGVIVHALEVVSLGEYAKTEFELLRGAALLFLIHQDQLPKESQGPLLQTLGKESSPERAVRLLQALGLCGRLKEPARILPYLDADSPLVRQAAARTLLVGQARGDILEAVLFHELSDVAAAGSDYLAEGMTGPQTSWVIQRASRGPLSRNSPLKVAMYGAASATAPADRTALSALWTRQVARDRGWLLPAIVSSMDDPALRKVLLTSTVPERVAIAQLAQGRPDLVGLLALLSHGQSDRLVAIALESRGYIDHDVQGSEYFQLAQGRSLFVEAAALRALRRAWSRGVVASIDPKWLSEGRCASQNAGVAVAAWGFAAELNQPCGGQLPTQQLLIHPDARVRLEIARGLLLSQPGVDRERALLRCAILERDAQVAHVCAADPPPKSKSNAASVSVRLRAQISVSWLSTLPAGFPFLVVQDARPRLVVSDEHGMVYLSEPSPAVLDVSLAY